MAESNLEASLSAGLAALGEPPTPVQVDQLAHYLQLLEKWNHAFNLTAVRDPEEMVTRHVLDSLATRPYLYGGAILDVGTGAGLPGIPLAVMASHQHFGLLDSVGKKIRFLRHAVGELALSNCEVVQSRVEAYAPESHYDTVVCRAFASTGEFVAQCGRLVAREGRLLAMKGRDPERELSELPPGWRGRCERVEVPGLDEQRHVVIVERGVDTQ